MLTGKTRYRAENRFRARPLLVLQVEERMRGETDCYGLTAPDYCVWRDANVEDLAELERLKGEK